jgi:hypothetical protein
VDTHAKRFVWLVPALVLGGSVSAQGLSKETGPARIIKMFDFFCLSQLPDLDSVRKAAGFGEFAQITGKELEQYQFTVPADELYAWSFHDLGARYVLTAAKSKPDEELKRSAPAFAKSTGVTCSLSFPSEEPAEALSKELVARLRRAPDKSWEEGAMRVYAWSDKTDRLLSHVHYYAPTKTGLQSVLSARAFIKD